MSSSKRKASISFASRPQRRRTDIGDEDILSSPPGPLQVSQGDVQDTIRKLSDRSALEKSEWRDHMSNGDAFVGWVDWPADVKRDFRNRSERKADLQAFVLSRARMQVGLVQQLLQWGNRGGQINWSSLSLDSEEESHADDIVTCWIELQKLDSEISPEYLGAYEIVLSQLLPIPSQLGDRITRAAQAFHTAGKLTPYGAHPSSSIYDRIVEYYRLYPEGNHLAPYTSLVGPSGIGKSFAISEMAMVHNLYIIYISLAGLESLVYPRGSRILTSIPWGAPKDRQCQFWLYYLAVALQDVELCRNSSITPQGFFKLQTLQAYDDYQQTCATDVTELTHHKDQLKKKELTEADIAHWLSQRAVDRKQDFQRWHETLLSNGHQGEDDKVPEASRNTPHALVCIDEAHALLKSQDMIPFCAVRQAFRAAFQKDNRNRSVRPILKRRQRDFFAVLLATSSRVTNFSPLARHDPSQKHRQSAEVRTRLFSPLFSIDTIDLFLPGGVKFYPDESDGAVRNLLQAGRPLWGAIMKAGEGLAETIELARQKIVDTTDNFQRLALLSYRVNFYVGSNSLAEALVSNRLRYVVHINEARDLTQTYQPSEPILAHTAATQMRNPKLRRQVMEDFVTESFEGSINVGDLGEMVAAIIILFSFDAAWSEERGTYPAAVTFSGFMNALLGSKVAALLGTCMKTDAEVESLWHSGTVFCNHFVRLQNPPDAAILKKAFYRGCALFPPFNFPGADILVPIHLKGGTMSFLGIQVKNRKHDRAGQRLTKEAANSAKDVAEALGLSVPTVCIFMSLRGHASAPNDVKIVIPGKSARKTRHGSGGSRYNWHVKNKQLAILAIGLNETLYPVTVSCPTGKTKDSEAILPLLQRLLDCNSQIPHAQESAKVYVDRLMALEWSQTPSGSGKPDTSDAGEAGEAGEAVESSESGDSREPDESSDASSSDAHEDSD